MTEKSYAPSSNENKLAKQQDVKHDAHLAKAPKKEDKKVEKEEIKKEKKTVQKVKKDFAILNSYNISVSSKVSRDICNFIRYKPIERALKELKEITQFKRALPMRGEYPHRKGNDIMAGRYPQNAVNHFIKLLDSLNANSGVNGIEEPVILEAVANIASKPFARFGRWKRKSTNVYLKSVEKNKLKELKKYLKH